MFGWFSKKEKKPARRCRDLVWMNSAAKWDALPLILRDKDPVFIFGWFRSSIERAKQAITQAGQTIPVQNASEFNEIAATNAVVILLEHYPLPDRENFILSSLGPKEILVLSALDEPLFTFFGGDRNISMMKKMGMAESEMIEHRMIGSSIELAQQKISKKVLSDFSAKSQQEWFQYSGLQNTG